MRPLLTSFVLLVQCGVLSFAQAPNYVVESLTVDDGLSENNVWSIIQDADGYIWIGSFAGLSRYDGYNFVSFGMSDSATAKVASSPVGGFSLSRDARYLWVCSDMGFHRFDRWKQTFQSFPHVRSDTTKASVLTNDNVQYLLEDADGSVWIGTEGGLNRFSPATNSVTQYPLDPNEPKIVTRYGVLSLLRDFHGMLLIGTTRGLFTLDASRRSLMQLRYKNGSDSVMSLSEDSSHHLWVGTMQGDVRVLNDQRKLVAEFHGGSAAYVLLSLDSVNTLCGMRNGKLLHLNRRTGEQLEIKYNGHEENAHAISSLFKDRSGALWIGTYGRGVKKLIAPQEKFDIMRFNVAKGNPLQKAVWAATKSRDGTMWIGTSNTLCKLDTVTGEYSEVVGAPKGKQVRAILEDGNSLWLGLLEGGLARWDRRNNRWAYFTHDPNNTRSLSFDLVYALYKDKSGVLWIGTNAGGLNSYDPSSETFLNYHPSPTLKWVTSICEDETGDLWLGMWNGGLAKFHRSTKTFSLWSANKGQPQQSREKILVVHAWQQDRNILWLGSASDGLYRFERSSGTFITFTENDGLANNSIYGILEDDFGNLWMSTNKGISRFDPRTNAFKNFDVNDGLQGNEFNLGAYFKDIDGTLYFGGDHGVNAIRPMEDINRCPPQVVLTEFKKFGTPVAFDSPLSQRTEIALLSNENAIAFEFVGIHYQRSKEIQYAYRLDGYNADWVRNGTKREAGFVNLPPGDYVFNVKAANSDGVWSEPVSIAVTIAPPLWKAWWFHILWVSLMGAMGYVWHRGRVRLALQIEHARHEQENKVRMQLQEDVHDYVSGHAARIAEMSRVLKHDHSHHHSGASLSSIADHADLLLRELGNIQWTLDPTKNSLFDLVARLQNIGNALLSEKSIVFHIAGVNERYARINLPMEWRKELLLLFHEGMNNVVKHAQGCENVTLSTEVKDSLLVMCLSDDGEGFDETQCLHKNGLHHMRARAERLHAELQVQSNPQSGTVICLIGKLPLGRVGGLPKAPYRKTW